MKAHQSGRTFRGGLWHASLFCALLALLPAADAICGDTGEAIRPLLREFCFECHGADVAEAHINLEQMTADFDFGRGFKDWEKVAHMLRANKMPPAEMPQPDDARRHATARAIDDAIRRYIQQHAGDAGPVVLRRLTSAEYAYTIQDLTGLQLNVAGSFVSDAVAGEGFTNAGGGQFMQDSTLERYLEAAKRVASHAVVGAGPLRFYADPGRTGRELSAINRIQQIYRAHGFRTAAGEGAEPFGLDLYCRAMLVAWQYRFREELGHGDATLAELARREGASERICQHIWSVVNQDDASFPLLAITAQWQSLPSPAEQTVDEARKRCQAICDELRQWQSLLAAAAGDEEEAAVLTAGDVQVARTHSLRADISWAEGAETAVFELSVSPASNHKAAGVVVIWRNARLRLRREDRSRTPPQPLASLVNQETAARMAFAQHPRNGPIGEHDFVLTGPTTHPVVLRIPPGTIAAELRVDVELDVEHGPPGIVRCRISDGEVPGETAAEVGATSTLLADPNSPLVAEWQSDVARFARLLPEVSHREPAPSDRDPIPAPFDNTYNLPERNHFHYAIKYHRDDAFFVEHVANDATRRRLDEAWTDLLTSFEYHDANLRFVAEKFALDLHGHGIADLEQDEIDRLPDEPRKFIQHYHDEFTAMQQSLRSAERGHVVDVVQFGGLAWRRPLTDQEQRRLREFYVQLRGAGELDHVDAIRGLLARILVAPAFLYRAEPPAASGQVTDLSDWQLASRLSYFVWSSCPDEPLRSAALEGRLRAPAELASQARRMLRDQKSRRLTAEYFGQWLGFYRFDEYHGIDTERFPEFTDALQSAMYEEAIQFFAHIVQEDCPVDDILLARYTFLNRRLAEHYSIAGAAGLNERFARIDDLRPDHRGGLLGLGAVLAATSAPLRTSAVKRGDWVLRRVLGSPVPPPPADAGSIPADDVLDDGLTVRQRLEAHRREASCVNCHARIDPFGFALEHYDTLGRWRETYRDGQPIEPYGVLADGTTISGPDGLRNYLADHKPLFHRTLCTKLLGYALGRAELASDRPLIDDMMNDLRDGGTLADLVQRIVVSRQFRTQSVP